MRPHRLRRLLHFTFIFAHAVTTSKSCPTQPSPRFFRKKPAKVRVRKLASEKKSLDMAKAAKLVPCSFKKPRIRCPIWKGLFSVTRPTFAYKCNSCGTRSPKTTNSNANSCKCRRRGWIGFVANRNR